MDRSSHREPADRIALRAEIAAAAARLIADEGLDYGSAKQRGAREVLGNGPIPRNSVPGNDEVDRALLEHLTLFDPEHAARLKQMRAVALDWMRRLERFNPLATGAVWKGIAAEHALVHLQLFYDNGKEVQFFLLDQRIDFDSVSVPHFKGGGEVEAYQFEWGEQVLLLSVYDEDDIKGALKHSTVIAGQPPSAERGNLAALRALSQQGAQS